jgi:mannose-6-phosphate isomerase
MSQPAAASVSQIEPIFVERVWGRHDLAPLFGKHEKRIGEVWFPLGEAFPLLVKFLFTSERLSIQVHPNDEYAALHERSRGKTEMWHILAAEADATIALGLTREVDREELRSAIANGSVLELVEWVPVQAGDTLFAPAGTIHAIGPGIVLCEIQQNSDVTYRLYDYGRARELHLERGLAVSDLGPFQGHREFPVTCDSFVAEMLEISSPEASSLECEYLLIPIAGSGTVAGKSFEAGQCWKVPASAGPVTLTATPGTRVLRARAC